MSSGGSGSSGAVYLAKQGEAFGPFSDDEIRAMKKSGEFDGYAWIFKAGDSEWTPLDPPPALPKAAAVSAEKPAAPAKTVSEKIVSDKKIEAVLHDFQQVFTGTLQSMSDSGCEMLSPGTTGLSRRGPVMLSLLDPASGKSVNVPAQLVNTTRKEGVWAYQLKWEKCPDLIRG